MRSVGAVLGVGLLAGCGIFGGQAREGSCDFRGSGDGTFRCETISDSDITRQATTLEALKLACGTSMGVYIDGACPKAGIVAGCQLGGNQSGAGEVTTNWYYDNPDGGVLDHLTSPADVKANNCDKGDAPSTLVTP